MLKTFIIIGGSIITLITLTAIVLPFVLSKLGLHPHMKKQSFRVSGKRALIITTSHDKLGDKGKATGVFASEMTVPYYEFLDNGMLVDVASMKGGAIPVEKMSVRWPVATLADRRFLKDKNLQKKVRDSLSIRDVDFSAYDVVFFAGGWGAAYDLGYSEYLGTQVSKAYQDGVFLGSVCHGALGLINAVDENGKPILEGRRVTAVTNKQVKELGITNTPMHPETELRKLNADFESETSMKDMLATHVVVDGTLVTGQNQNSGQETAYEIMKLLEG
jgi:putative intracellular protease/amidase